MTKRATWITALSARSLALLTAVGAALTACGGSAPIGDGRYELVGVVSGSVPTTPSGTLALTIDRTAATATLERPGAAAITWAIGAQAWESGCPTQQGGTDVEMLTLSESPLSLEGLSFSTIAVIASCGRPYRQIDLHDPTQGGGVYLGGDLLELVHQEDLAIYASQPPG